jgi:hypothetical protein
MLLLKSTKFRGRGFRTWSAFSILMISSCIFANACESARTNEFYEPVTNGDGIRYPLALSPAIWKVAGCINPVLGTDRLIGDPILLRPHDPRSYDDIRGPLATADPVTWFARPQFPAT